MSLLPNLRPLIILGNPDAPHTLDIFLDYVCPFSAKIANKLENIVKPLITSGGKYDGKVKVIYRLQVQPWHAMSTITNEAGLAALRASPEHFWAFSLAVRLPSLNQGIISFDDSDVLSCTNINFDIPSQDLSIRQAREKLSALAAQVLPADKVDEFKDLLALKGTPNGGNAVTNDLKYNIKFSRQNGVHVSPTVLLDGLQRDEVSSSWDAKEWDEWLGKNLIV